MLTGSQVSPSAELSAILQLSIQLGCRCPTEHTVKWFCSLWQVTCNSPCQLANQDHSTKYVMLQHVKATFDGLRKNSADPHSWIDKLPDNPTDFVRKYPVLFNAPYSVDMPPIACPIDITGLLSYDNSYGCRGGAKIVPMAAPSAPSAQSPTSMSGGPTGMLEQLASTLAANMQQMSNAQNRMFDTFMAGGAAQLSEQPRCTSESRQLP